MKEAHAQTLSKVRQILATNPHFSIRRTEGQAYVFCSDMYNPPLVTRAQTRELINLGFVHMKRLTELDGWEYVPGDIGQYEHVGEHLAAVATFDDIHRDPTTRHRFGDYHRAPMPVDNTAVVAIWQDPGKK